ncbi:glycerate kinase [Alkalicoccobacillus porphyridii]|uniref:Glycerate kinase n=1 Tax=Alkalicoccobacillus porphyridii TaxID=2597270 RepID=A0A553ZTE2_9BACI|nr:glycerate kinase [Alkalicoccobacillus porphyridii]TSB44732.1 glycerate kinase [Alkalicoccobacillus porphyridii]
MKKIIIAPDSFKESFSALEAATAIEKGFKQVFPDATYLKIPMADGGEGTVESLADALNGELRTIQVTGPLGNKVEATYALAKQEEVAVIEMASASGLHHVPQDQRNPLITTTYGTGELVVDALKNGATRIILGLGGSATNDGGAGMAQALGIKLLDENGHSIKHGGGALHTLHRIDTRGADPLLAQAKIEVASDVENPLLGENGATAIYGPQKGATTPEIRAQLENGLTHFARVVDRQLGMDIRDTPGAGAAGGLGAGLLAFVNPRMASGVTLILEITRFQEKVSNADLVITGEGRLDYQSIFGKTPIGVARAAKQDNIPVIALAGQLGHGYEAIYKHGIDAAYSLVPGAIPLEDAMKNGLTYLEELSRNIAMTWKLGKDK